MVLPFFRTASRSQPGLHALFSICRWLQGCRNASSSPGCCSTQSPYSHRWYLSGTSHLPASDRSRSFSSFSPINPQTAMCQSESSLHSVGAVSSGDTGSEEKGQREKERENSLRFSALSEDQILENLPGYMSLPGPAFRPLVPGTSLQSHR